MQDINQQAGVRINLADTPWTVCECGGHTFEPGLMFKKISSLLSPSGKEEVMPVEIFKCTECKKIPGFVHNKIPGIPDNEKASKKLSD